MGRFSIEAPGSEFMVIFFLFFSHISRCIKALDSTLSQCVDILLFHSMRRAPRAVPRSGNQAYS